MGAREAAFLSLLNLDKTGVFLSESFVEIKLSEPDRRFLQELCYGVIKRMLTLEALAKKVSKREGLRLGPKEKYLTYCALYQFFFMDKVPLYAIANESVKLAKKYCGKFFASFLNALLRNLEREEFVLEGDLETVYSFPKLFVDSLCKRYPIEEVKSILEILNLPGRPMCRKRGTISLENPVPGIEDMYYVDPAVIEKYRNSSDVYFQNATQVYALNQLQHDAPKRILDICAAPGGKLLLLHDRFPEAELFGNDISPKRIERLEENMRKYGIRASVTKQDALDYCFKEAFDLILVDAPCSNSGVFHKRPEARWRLSKKSLDELMKKQLKMIEKAKSMLTPEGKIWYMTCSILPQENEEVIEKACKLLDLKVDGEMHLIVPNFEGWDGGFSCSLER